VDKSRFAITLLGFLLLSSTVYGYCRPVDPVLMKLFGALKCDNTDHIYLDAPWRISSLDETIPVFVIVDAEQLESDLQLKCIRILDKHNGYLPVYSYCGTPVIEITPHDGQDTMYINVPKSMATPQSGEYVFDLEYETMDSQKHLLNLPVTIKVGDDAVPALDSYSCGDTHYHGEYTGNFVEFGGDFDATIIAGKSIGLGWSFITDHSFDLTSQLWAEEKDDIADKTSDAYTLIRGEEVSCRHPLNEYMNLPFNLINAYSHFLAYNTNEFIPGREYDANPLSVFSLDNSILCSDIASLVSQKNGGNAFGYVAHPLDGDDPGWLKFGDPFRTYWQDWDTPYTGLEIWNGWDDGDFSEVERGMDKLDIMLSKLTQNDPNRRIYISAGSDAHGDFQKYGRVKTCCQMDSPTEENILDAMKNGRCYLSSGPGIELEIESGKTKQVKGMGETLNLLDGENITLTINYKSSPEFGEVDFIESKKNGDLLESFDDSHIPSDFDGFVEVGDSVLFGNYFYRAWLETSTNDRAYTNPIWVNVTSALVYEPLYLSLVVGNDGLGDANGFMVEVWRGVRGVGEMVYEGVLSVPAGGHVVVEAEYTPEVLGMTGFYFYLDPLNQVLEADESDNNGSRSFLVNYDSKIEDSGLGAVLRTLEPEAIDLAVRMADELDFLIPDFMRATRTGGILDFSAGKTARQYYIEMSYDPYSLNVPEENLRLYHINADSGSLELVKNAVVDKAGGRIHAWVPHLSAYTIIGDVLPDLEVGVLVENKTLREKDETVVHFTVENNGYLDAWNVSIDVYAIGRTEVKPLFNLNVSSIAVNKSYAGSFTWNTTNMRGEYSILAYAGQPLEEYNQSDNIATDSIMVYERDKVRFEVLEAPTEVERYGVFTYTVNATCLKDEGCENMQLILDPIPKGGAV